MIAPLLPLLLHIALPPLPISTSLPSPCQCRRPAQRTAAVRYPAEPRRLRPRKLGAADAGAAHSPIPLRGRRWAQWPTNEVFRSSQAAHPVSGDARSRMSATRSLPDLVNAKESLQQVKEALQAEEAEVWTGQKGLPTREGRKKEKERTAGEAGGARQGAGQGCAGVGRVAGAG